MMILEHEAKALLRTVGVAVPDGTLIKPGLRAPKVREYPVAVKAQVRSGGRGKQLVAVTSGNSSRTIWETKGAATVLVFGLP